MKFTPRRPSPLLTHRRYFWASGYLQIVAQKIRQEKLLKFTKNFELYQVFMYNFVSKYSNISNIYYSQKELKHLGLEILVYMEY